MKSETANIFGFAGHMVPVAILNFALLWGAAVDKMYTKSMSVS